jgi:ribosomal protein S18 acetylase RimI-like enzyme
MIEIFQVYDKEDIDEVRELTLEYLHWVISQAQQVVEGELEINTMFEYSMSELDKYMQPDGQLLLARYNNEVSGSVFVRKLASHTCEIKRMYVRPDFRGKRIGLSLLDKLIDSAKQSGYSTILLDSMHFMEQAHVLYRALGLRKQADTPNVRLVERWKNIWFICDWISKRFESLVEKNLNVI